MPSPFPKTLIPHLTNVKIFDAPWYSETYPDVALSGMTPHAHYKQFGVVMGRAPNADLQDILTDTGDTIAKQLVRAAIVQAGSPDEPPEFDAAFYLQTNPQIGGSKLTPYAHFHRHGHKNLRNPSPDFDLVWYLQNYGHTFDTDEINGFAHYLQIGRDKGYTPHPPRKVVFDKEKSRTLSDGARRACLFAAYDCDARIDEYVLIYLRDLAKHADVFYMADCDMPASEMAKLDGIVKGAWAERHGAYDFGSYSILARDLVGWDTLATYDEVIFANDSCYLVQPLADTFEKMNAKPCAWWGLQATKRLASTRAAQPFPVRDAVMDIDDVKENYLSRFEFDPIYDFHIGSYFMVFRRDLIQDVRFQRVINAIDVEPQKRNIVLKYEVGITHFLIGHGYEFSTWGQTLTQDHPVYTDVAFDLLEDGFPVFKRYFLSENPYKVSSLSYWKVALRQANSVTSIEQIEANFLRVSNAEKLYENFNILKDGVVPAAPISAAAFASYDAKSPKYDHYWGFPVCYLDHTLSDNNRALFEMVKDDPTITKVIFTRKRTIQVEGINVICVPLLSHEGQVFLTRCRNLFVRHGAQANLHWPVDGKKHNIVNLWHGIPLKRIGTAGLNVKGDRHLVAADNARLNAVIAASDVDRLAMASAYVPKVYEDIWLTGLPRHDMITKPKSQLPADMLAQLKDIDTLVGPRKMVLFCPTFRNAQEDGYFSFSPAQVKKLAGWLKAHNMVMGVREHSADEARLYSSQLVGDAFIRVDAGRFADVEMLYRKADMLITDYSSCFIDYMLTGRPVISFAYDLEAYKERERGLFYELEDVFPGPIAQTFNTLMKALDTSVTDIGSAPSEAYKLKRKFFIKYPDAKNAQRVIEHTKAANTGSEIAPSLSFPRSKKTAKSVLFLYQTHQGITNRYRIFSLLPQLRQMGWTVHAVDINLVTANVLSKFEFVSLCRVTMSTKLMDVIEAARHQGATIVFDTDDLLHSEEEFQTSEYFLRDCKNANRAQQLNTQTKKIMGLADAFTITTQALLTSVSPFQRPAQIVPNSLSDRLLEFYSSPPERKDGDTVHISYLSGTATHSADFSECRDALIEVLLQRPNVSLHIVGELDVDDMLAHGLEDQIVRYGLMPYEAMHDFLRGMDLNLAPLTDNVFNDAKSELKIFEAALHEAPTIASPSAAYGAAITHQETGYLARSHDDWIGALFAAVDDPKARHTIGRAARAQIVPAFSAKLAAKLLSDFLETLGAAK